MRVERLWRSSAALEINQNEFVVLGKRGDEVPPAIYVCAQAVKAEDGITGSIDFFVQTN
jgi:hypothetical protein